jgi:hypothetical protein
VKYNSSGDFKWAVFDSFGVGGLNVVATDSFQIIVGGHTTDGYTLVKYNSAGERLWKCTRSTISSSYPIMKMSGAGDIYILGGWMSSKLALVKYTSAGLMAWTAIIDSINNTEHFRLDIDSLGNSYITATHYSWKSITMKVSPTGTILWKRFFIDENAFEYCPESIGQNQAGNVFVVGISRYTGQQKRIVLMYDSSGNLNGLFRTDLLLNDPLLYANNDDHLYLVSGKHIGVNLYDINVMRLRTKNNGNEKDPTVPDKFKLYPNYPNPFNADTFIRFDLPKPSKITLEILNLNGQKIQTLFNGSKKAGEYRIKWNASGLGSGIYYYTLKTEYSQETRKCLLIK